MLPGKLPLITTLFCYGDADFVLLSQLLTLDEKEPRRLFEGNALIRRLVRVGVLDESRMKLDYVLALKPEDFLERRLQTCVYKLGLAKSIHHARVLIRQRHIRYTSARCTHVQCLSANF